MSDQITKVGNAVRSVLPNVYAEKGGYILYLSQNGNNYKFVLPICANSVDQGRIDGYIESALAHFKYSILKDFNESQGEV